MKKTKSEEKNEAVVPVVTSAAISDEERERAELEAVIARVQAAQQRYASYS